jgi:hypothetical protein
MKWRTNIELTYRVFARQLEDSTLAFDQMLDDIQMDYPVRASFGEITEDFWPIRPEDLEKAAEKGLFVTERRDKSYVVVRSMQISIVCDDLDAAKDDIGLIVSKYEDQFAVANVVQEFITEIQAV